MCESISIFSSTDLFTYMSILTILITVVIGFKNRYSYPSYFVLFNIFFEHYSSFAFPHEFLNYLVYFYKISQEAQLVAHPCNSNTLESWGRRTGWGQEVQTSLLYKYIYISTMKTKCLFAFNVYFKVGRIDIFTILTHKHSIFLSSHIYLFNYYLSISCRFLCKNLVYFLSDLSLRISYFLRLLSVEFLF